MIKQGDIALALATAALIVSMTVAMQVGNLYKRINHHVQQEEVQETEQSEVFSVPTPLQAQSGEG